MNLEDHKSENLISNLNVKLFPNPINVEWNINNPVSSTFLEAANLNFEELNAFYSFVRAVNVFIRMQIVKAATELGAVD